MRRSRTKRRLIAACAGSFALHALVLLGVTRLSWEAVEYAPDPSLPVVWLGDLRVPDRMTSELVPARPEPVPPENEPALPPAEREVPPEPEPRPEPESSPEAESESSPEAESESPPEPEPDSRPEPEPDPPPAPEPPPPPQPEPESSPQATPQAEPAPQPEAAPTAPGPEGPAEPARDREAETFVVTEADLEEAWRRAREASREQSYRTFSLDDVVEPAPPEEPGPEESIFEAAERFRGNEGPSVLSPGAARTRVGRALAEFCNALTGGFGLGVNGMTFATVCADPGESAKLFAHIKPAYLRSRPVCTEVETAVAAVDAEPTIKCELVEQEE